MLRGVRPIGDWANALHLRRTDGRLALLRCGAVAKCFASPRGHGQHRHANEQAQWETDGDVFEGVLTSTLDKEPSPFRFAPHFGHGYFALA